MNLLKKSDFIILLIHGFCGSSLNNKILEDNFIKDGFDVLSFDLPGHGEDYENFNKADWKDWLKEVEDQFDKIKSYKYIILIGFSMGANLALILYSKLDLFYQKKIKIILLSPAFSANKKFFPNLLNVIIGYLFNRSYKIKSTNPGCNSTKYKKYYKNYISFISAKRFLDLYILINKAKKLIGKVDSPILIFHSKKDILSSYSESLKIFKKLRSTFKVFISLKKSNHFIQLDFERNIVYELSKLFIENDFDQFKSNEKVKTYLK